MRLLARCLALVVVTLFAGLALGQVAEDIELNIFRPRLEVAADGYPNRTFEDSDEEFGNRSGYLSFNVPLGSTHIRPEKRVLAYQFLLQTRLSGSSPEITFLSKDHTLYNGGLSVAGVFLGQNKNLYVVSLGASLAEDDETIHDAETRFYGLGLGTHRLTNDKVTLVYGGAYSFAFGRGLVLPAFGVIWRVNPKWSLTGIAPFLFNATYRANDKLSLRFRTGPAGNRYRFSNEDDFPGQPDTVFLRIAQWRTTAGIDWKASEDLAFRLEAGVASPTRIAFSASSSGRETFFDERTKAAPYLRAGVVLTFGKTVLEQMKEDAGSDDARDLDR